MYQFSAFVATKWPPVICFKYSSAMWPSYVLSCFEQKFTNVFPTPIALSNMQMDLWGCRLEVIIINELKKFFAVAPSTRSLVDHGKKRNFPHQHHVMLTTTTPHFVVRMVCFQQNDYLNPGFQQFSSTIIAISYSDSLWNWQKWIFYRHETGGLGPVSGRNEG